MNTAQPFFLTSAIPYVNAEPHLGNALELVQSDAVARYERARGRDVFFSSGTDDNSLKNVRAAATEHTTPTELVARHGAQFRWLAEKLDVTHDDFIHTASDPRHVPAVHALWERCRAAGDVYRKTYRGLYCVGCEHFLRESEIASGGCPAHPEPLELLDEDNWFFRLSRYERPILEAIASDRLEILPKERKNEVCRFIEGGLEDFSISRSRARAKGWGIPVPGDDSQIVYVWFDALANYLAVLGFPDGANVARFWQSSGQRVHVIGKDIVRFHALYWPGILLSAGLPLPTSIRVHGHITRDGKKLGKSLGNAIDPCALVQRYGVDAVRYYLLAHLHTSKDGDFREELLRGAYGSELAGKLGNLLQRVCALCEQNGVRFTPEEPLVSLDPALLNAAQHTRSAVDTAVTEFALHDAVRAIFELVAVANRYADRSAPWQLAKARREATTENDRARADEGLRTSLSDLVQVLRITAELLAPFLPRTARGIEQRLVPGPRLGEPLFPALRPA
ncbi:MAG TPA: methionine--tRNA ligase [Polyangiaceae bacterium]|jgi:methionyl-tRNA synthetase|nr:methionine--tRNA ligase [Polyangiaceae bacterium]